MGKHYYNAASAWSRVMTAASQEPIARILAAATFAAERHRDQRRKGKDASPYINHPLALAHLLAERGERDPKVLMAALLHDTVEDTATTFADLEHNFGQEVADIVREVTDDKTLSRSERKRLQIEHAAQLSRRAKLVKLADKICNLRDILVSPPAGWSAQRQREYFDWAKAVVDPMRGVHPDLEALFDREYARKPALPP
jgi:GTP diphosphokinase / guanosine-3',5'-bis(diphosphate) 3'-diphosphatase